MLRVWTKGLYTALIALSWQASAFGTDTLLVNGHIYTGNKAAPWADAIAIKGARIEAVGSRMPTSPSMAAAMPGSSTSRAAPSSRGSSTHTCTCFSGLTLCTA